MKKILIVFGTFVAVSLIFLGLTNMDEINAYINNEEVSDDTLALSENTESNEWSLDEDGSEVEAFVETEKGSENFASTDGTRPERGTPPEGFDGERPTPPDGEFPSDDTYTGSTSTTTE